MFRRVLALTIPLSVLSTIAIHSQDRTSLASQLEALHEKWFTAFDKGDGATMDRIEVSNLVLIFPDGTIWQKPGPREGKQKPTDYSGRTLRKLQVREFGDVAILTGQLTSKAPSRTDQAATTVVFVRQSGGWRIASAQWSATTPPSTK